MKSKVLISLALSILILILAIGCQSVEDLIPERQGMSEEELAIFNMSIYAEHFHFGIDADINFIGLQNNIADGINAHFLVFVHDIEEIIDPPDDKIFLFPTEATFVAIEVLNVIIAEYNFDLSAFTLSYPITLNDLVDNWENVSYFYFNALGIGQRDRIRDVPDRYFEIYQARMLEELNLSEEDIHLRQLLLFGQWLHFEHNMDLRFMDMRLEIESGTHRYTDVVFVHSTEEALDVIDGVIALWPTGYTLIAVEILNDRINRSGWLEFEDFDLNYPITIQDVVDEWENVFEVWQRIGVVGRYWNFVRSMPVRELFDRTSGD